MVDPLSPSTTPNSSALVLRSTSNHSNGADGNGTGVRWESSNNFGTTTTNTDILHELYWYVIRAREHDDDKNNKNEEDTTNSSSSSYSITIGDVITTLSEEGIWFWRDERFYNSQNVALEMVNEKRTTYTKSISDEVKQRIETYVIDFYNFCKFITPCARLFLKTFSEELVIPDWRSFITDITYHYYKVENNTNGQNAQYIPILQNANSNKWSLSVCSTDGQRFSIGDTLDKFTLQSVSKPVTYALGLAKDGEEYMKQWINVEPAGRPFNTQDLDPITHRPFNASINSGAIMAAGVYASTFPPEYTWNEIVDTIRSKWYELCGNDLEVGFSYETYQSEKDTAYNNFAIAYNLKGRTGLPRNIDLHKMLDVYLGCCSIEITTEALAVAAATLANGGVCPITGKEVFPADITRAVLSETMLCGMYDQAGHFAVEVGLPAKSGVSGALLVIVPNVFGFATFSPRLNEKGNSVRGIEFCKRLVGSYRVHLFEPLRSGNTGAKIDPRKNGWKNERMQISRMAWAVSVGEIHAIRLRDIYLFALCQTAISSSEGLSDHMVNLIRTTIQSIYQAPVDEERFHDILQAVRKHPGELRFLEELTHDIYIPDSFRSLVTMSMLDIIVDKNTNGTNNYNNNKIGDVERNIAVRILVMLGTARSVALMEINRYIHHQMVGHRYQEYEMCEMINDLDRSHHHHRNFSGLLPSPVNNNTNNNNETDDGGGGGNTTTTVTTTTATNGIMKHSNSSSSLTEQQQKQQLEVLRATTGRLLETVDVTEQEELLFLRKEVSRLRNKVEELTIILRERPGVSTTTT